MKQCSKCKLFKTLDNFARNVSQGDGLQNYCRRCSSVRMREYYKKNAPRMRAQISARRRPRLAEHREYVRLYKAARGCNACGEREPVVLDLHHHQQDKEFTVAAMLGHVSMKRLAAEMAKCIVLCSNCHRRLHAGLISF